MKLSIIIVNYNVEHFLEQCLLSVEKAIRGVDADVWVVDNASSDGSMKMVSERFPWVNRIENKDNVGFSKANNQAARASSSEYLLLLNPDTVLPEDNLSKVLAFMDKNKKCGALGVRMIDGTGEFLPESKRGLPTPSVAFNKIFGLSSLFPQSPHFARYHLGHLPEHENHRVEILAGAYMMMRREAWDKAGELDETYFMYGEDIDLSYSIEKAGYEVHYFAESPIIHYKGESTKKGSLNYVFLFYQAMIIFAKKHLSTGYARFFGLFIRFAIYLRAGLSLTKRLIRAIAWPLIDGTIFVVGMQFIIRYWEHNHRFIEGGSYPEMYKWGIVPAYALLWIIGLWMFGAYKKPIRFNRLPLGLALGAGFIFAAYALSPDEYRFSRALIVLGGAWMTLVAYADRILSALLMSDDSSWWKVDQRRIGFVGESTHLPGLKTWLGLSRLSFVEPVQWDSLEKSIKALDLNEIIFDAEGLSYHQCIEAMDTLSGRGIRFKIAYPSKGWMIGSDSIHTKGSSTLANAYALASSDTQKSKRAADIGISIVLLLLSPLCLLIPRMRQLWASTPAVLIGKKTWVGYSGSGKGLPSIPPAVIPVNSVNENGLTQQADELYAKTAEINQDIRRIIRFVRKG